MDRTTICIACGASNRRSTENCEICGRSMWGSAPPTEADPSMTAPRTLLEGRHPSSRPPSPTKRSAPSSRALRTSSAASATAAAQPDSSLEEPPTQSSGDGELTIDPEDIPLGAPRVLAGFLVVYDCPLGRFLPVTQGRTRIGREVAQPGVLTIDHPTVSTKHAVLYAAARPGRIKIEDVGSRNGTYVDDRRLATMHPEELRDGQVLRLGGFRAVIKIV